MTNSMIEGVVRGRTIELEADPGLADGQRVQLTIQPVVPRDEEWGAGLRRTAGSMADDPEFDAVMEEVRRYRKSWGHREPPE